MATNPRLEQLKSALVAADKAGATEDARRLAEAIRLEQATQQALQAEEFNRQQGFELQPKTAEEIKVAQDRAVAEAERFRDERRVGLSRIAGQGLSGAIEAAPSGVAAAGQAGVANVLEEGRNRSIFDIEPSLLARAIPGGGSVVETAQNLAGNIAGRLTSPETDAALRERSAENLQETLAIRARNAEEAQRLRQQYVDQGGSGVAADIAGAVGSSATSFAPLAGAAIVGAVTRNPMAALATQRGLAVLPATQAYADAYAQFKSEYPNAPDSEAHRYAASMATVEFGVEALVPAGGALTSAGARQVAGAIARRTGTEAGTEAVTELAGQGIQLGLAPSLAPDSLEEAAYNVGIAAATGGLAGGAISVPTTFAEARGVANEARLQEQKRLAELRAVDEKLAEGAAVAQELPAVAQAERAIAELMSNLPEGGLDLETRRGEASTLLDTTPVIEEPAGPSSPFLPRSGRVNLEARQGEASTLLDVPTEVVAEPQGPVSVLPGVRPQEALALDTPRGEASPIEGPEATRMRFEAQRVDAEEQTAFLQNEKQTLLQNPTRENRVRVKEIDREIGRQAIRRAVAVNALSNPPSVQSAPVETPTPELPLTRQARVSTLEEARSLSQPTTQPAVTTPAPLPQTAPTAPLTRAERVAQQRTVAEQVLNPVTGQMETVVEAAVSPDDTRRKDVESFFSGATPEQRSAQAQQVVEAPAFDMRPSPRNRRVVSGDSSISYNVGQDGVVSLNLIRTAPEGRSKGSARAALEEFTRSADQQGSIVKLVVAEQDASTDAGRLERFYKDFGFERNGEFVDGSPVMVRAPQRQAAKTKEASAMNGDQVPSRTSSAQMSDTGITSGGRDLSVAISQGWNSTLKAVVEFAPNDAAKAIATKVVARILQLQKAGFEFSVNMTDPGYELTGGALGMSILTSRPLGSASSIEVKFNNPSNGARSGTNYETVLHELAHAATQAAINLNPDGTAASKLRGLFNDVVTHFNKRVREGSLTDFERRVFERRTNALADPNELLAWGLTNGEVQAWLNSFQPPKKRSGFSRLVDIVMDALGFGKKEETALTELLALSDEILTESLDPYIQEANAQGRSFGKQENTSEHPSWALVAAGGREIVWSAPDAALVRAKSMTGADMILLAVPNGLTRVDVKGFTGNAGISPARLQEIQKIADGFRVGAASQSQAQVKGGQSTKPDVAQARKQVLGEDTSRLTRLIQKRTSPFSTTGQAARKFDYYLSRLFSSKRGSTKATAEAMSRLSGVKERMDAEVTPAINQLRGTLRALKGRPDFQAIVKDVNKALKGEMKVEDSKAIPKEFMERISDSVNAGRKVIDKFSVEIGNEVITSYGGRDMPESAVSKLETIKSQIGKYLSRTYRSDLEPKYADEVWADFLNGVPEAVDTVQPLLNRLTKEITELPSVLEAARQEAENLSSGKAQFSPEDTFTGNQLRRMYENYIGSSQGRTKQDMISALDKFSKAADKDIGAEARRVVQEIMGVGKGMSSLAQYYRGLRSNDNPLKSRSSIPEEILKVWGEIDDPILNLVNTSQRMGTLLSGLKASNLLAETAPEAFSDKYDANTGKTSQIPDNPVAYGQLAGKYTDEGTFGLIAGQMEMGTALLFGKPIDPGRLGRRGGELTLNTLAAITRYQKLMGIVTNLYTFLSNATNVVVFPLINGNFSMKNSATAAKVAWRLVGSGFREKQTDPLVLEVLEMGIIDPVLTQAQDVINQRTKEARAMRRARVVGNIWRQLVGASANIWDTGLEGSAVLETFPKIWNYLNAKETMRKIHPGLSETDIKQLAAEETNRLNLTYSRVPEIVKATETLGISYVAGYMQQVLATSWYSGSSGARQAMEGIRSGNTELAKYGLKKIAGSSMAYALGTYGLTAAAEAMGWIGEDDDDPDARAFFDSLPFLEEGQQPMIIRVEKDGTVIYTDIGRLNPLDSTHSVIRAAVQGFAALAQGDTEGAEKAVAGAWSNLSAQFVGGGPVSDVLIRTVQGTPMPRAMENDAKWLHDYIVETMDYIPYVDRNTASNISNAAWQLFMPAMGKGPLRQNQLEEMNPETFGAPLMALALNIRAPVNVHNPFLNIQQQAEFAYANDSRAGTDSLKEILLSTEDVSKDEIKSQIQDVIDAEAEAFNELGTAIRGARYAGRMAGLPESTVRTNIQAALKNGNIREDNARAIAQGTAEFKPLIIGDSWGADAIQTELNRMKSPTRAARVARQAEMERRLAEIKQVMAEMQPRRRVSLDNL